MFKQISRRAGRILQTALATMFLLMLSFVARAQEQVWQNGYTKKDGTYVPGHYRTKPNSTTRDNMSSQGNTNPYTGKKGSRPNNYSPEASNYGGGKTIQTGKRGGQYYINDKGNKVYVPKK